MFEARYYSKRKHGQVQCRLCPHACVINPGERGKCQVRLNESGRLYALNYAKAIAIHDDPIEKKPLFHVWPGSITTSVATVGCNLTCKHCQNHDISQYPVRHGVIPGRDFLPSAVVKNALKANAKTISFTYTEPTIYLEWALDIAQLAASEGLGCILVSNAFTAEKPLLNLAENLVAANVDLKSFSDDFYRQVCGARLKPVLENIRLLVSLGVWVEVTTLLIPGLNDSEAELNSLAEFLVSVNPSIPWHLSRFHPDNQMLNGSATSLESIQMARAIAFKAGLNYAYSGNVWGDEGEHTRCPACSEVIVKRHGFTVLENNLKSGCCPRCSQSIEGRFC
jgi:pyruvate formate lyase activating enzyme